MIIKKFEIDGLMLMEPRVHRDQRGYFFEIFNANTFRKNTGIEIEFIQDNESKSGFGTLRGLHYQKPPFDQSKLVRVIVGKVLDIAVDIRHNSPTFGKWESVVLSGENKKQLFIPKGFAHGFVVLSETAVFSYKVDNYYASESDTGIMWNDSDLNCDWQIENQYIRLSEKDKFLQSFDDYQLTPDF